MIMLTARWISIGGRGKIDNLNFIIHGELPPPLWQRISSAYLRFIIIGGKSNFLFILIKLLVQSFSYSSHLPNYIVHSYFIYTTHKNNIYQPVLLVVHIKFLFSIKLSLTSQRDGNTINMINCQLQPSWSTTFTRRFELDIIRRWLIEESNKICFA